MKMIGKIQKVSMFLFALCCLFGANFVSHAAPADPQYFKVQIFDDNGKLFPITNENKEGLRGSLPGVTNIEVDLIKVSDNETDVRVRFSRSGPEGNWKEMTGHANGSIAKVLRNNTSLITKIIKEAK